MMVRVNIKNPTLYTIAQIEKNIYYKFIFYKKARTPKTFRSRVLATRCRA